MQIVSSLIPRPTPSSLFPYTTLFRSLSGMAEPGTPQWVLLAGWLALMSGVFQIGLGLLRQGWLMDLVSAPVRSEEHTSELQSRENLVCRLLLEKKNKDRTIEENLTDT